MIQPHASLVWFFAAICWKCPYIQFQWSRPSLLPAYSLNAIEYFDENLQQCEWLMQTMNVVYLALSPSIHALTAAVLHINNVWEQISPWHKLNASITCDWNFNVRWFCGLHYLNLSLSSLPMSLPPMTHHFLFPGADRLKCFAKVTLLVGEKSNQIL